MGGEGGGGEREREREKAREREERVREGGRRRERERAEGRRISPMVYPYACAHACVRVDTHIYTLSCTNSSQTRSHVYVTSPGQCEYAPITKFDFGSGMLA